ncbi:MAG: hypothetical protein Q9186_000833 [Xanthomendoza sp. 1 TL-2023]
MPQLRDVTVHVTDVDGNPLEEWGVQSLRGNKISTYIKSTTNVPFRISVRPRIPYLDYESPSGDKSQRRRSRGFDGVRIKMEDSEEDLTVKPSSTGRTYSRGGSLHGASSYRSQRRPYKTERPPPSHEFHRKSSYEEDHPPFTFLATLYLDGRKKPERKIVVYLDPNDKDFDQPTGQVSFKCRCVQGRDGLMREQAWVFKDVGIETIFDKIALRDGSRKTMEQEDVIVDAMKNSELGERQVGTCEEGGKIGQIVVELERVILGKKYHERNYRPKHYEDDQDDVNMEGVGHDVVHTTGFEHLRSLGHRPIRCVEFRPYMEGERPWATFQFFYRSHKQLQKFRFPGYPPDDELKPPRERQDLQNTLANLTPLSIAYRKHTAPIPAKEEVSSLQSRVREGGLGVAQNIKPKYDFRGYQEPLKDISDGAEGNPQQITSSSTKRPVSTQPIYGIDNDKGPAHEQGPFSAVIAVKERRTGRSSHPRFAVGASSARARKSNSSSSSLSSPPASLPDDSSVQPPANSPTTGFYDAFADPRRSSPKGSDFDIFRTLSDASLALTKVKTHTADGQLTPKSAIRNSTIYRGVDLSSDADADDEEGGKSEEESWESNDGDEGRESDKENMASVAGDDAGLHEQLFKISIGTKRQRGEGIMKESEEGEMDVKDGAVTAKDESGKIKTSPARVSIRLRLATPEKNLEEGKEMVALSGNTAEEQQSKRVKRRQNETEPPKGEHSGEMKSGAVEEMAAKEQEKPMEVVMEQTTG